MSVGKIFKQRGECPTVTALSSPAGIKRLGYGRPHRKENRYLDFA
jgi:hypothetical protein